MSAIKQRTTQQTVTSTHIVAARSATMLSSLVFFVLLVAGSSATLFSRESKPLWNDFRAHLLPLGSYFYKQLPRTANEANENGWLTPAEEATNTDADTQVLCPFSDPSMCLLFDKNGFIAGIQFGIVKYNTVGIPFPHASKAYFVIKKRFGYDCYVATFFFVEQSVLKLGGRLNLTIDGTGTGLWFQNGQTSKDLLNIPRLEKDMAGTGFNKEPCVPGQGVQYYFNITRSLPCENLFPIVVLFRHGNLCGFGFQTFGRYTPTGKNNWMEAIPTAVINPTLNDPPKCLSEWADTYNLFSLHMFFCDNPALTTCSIF